ncbi:2-dehydropantoate 2-reductase N-terminal domain-containing protein [Teichococcus vastitatis]|uniref:2-dehydropantoate 2-reductase n=1 Tax=Teichococcus vastitatis TaxID=2307076 RepID=A0ABS9W866_9PROT|nr:hypothetical protein [Pseudoroseomonas vastitatis]
MKAKTALGAAIEALRPAVDARTAVLPILNGLSHIQLLEEAFGTERVLGGLAIIQATLTLSGTVRHLAPFTSVTFGELDGRLSERIQALQTALAGTPVKAEAVPDICGRMWEKLVSIGTLAGATVLMRGNLGEIARAPDGAAWLERLLMRNVAIAAANGHAVRPEGKRCLETLRGSA